MSDAPRSDAPFIAELETANIHPLWDRYQRITPIRPSPRDPPFLWRWCDVEPYAMRSAGAVSLEDAERHALILAHPAFGGATQTTGNLLGAFTILEPGDRARPHRGGDPLLDRRRRRRHDRQRAALYHGGRGPHPDATDVLARSYQREQAPHGLVRRR
ncbi:MAG: hypothetical protein ACREFQ_01745 [Stellaceae bacterium]